MTPEHKYKHNMTNNIFTTESSFHCELPPYEFRQHYLTMSESNPTTQRCRIMISNRDYSDWNFVEPDTYAEKTVAESVTLINPIHLKLFSRDLIDISTPIPTLVHSPTRTTQIAGVLILEANKTYGRTANQKRLFYKCIPNDRYLPAFLIPYAPDVGFTKTQKNRFVVFRFDNWDHAHPHGILTENLGEVSDLSAFYEYQLFCRSLHVSMTEFNQTAKRSAKMVADGVARIAENPVYRIQPWTTISDRRRIFSIDPAGATDFDDAFSIQAVASDRFRISVYIANVYVWLETLTLWKSFSNRVGTIYLPDFKRPMLPTILSESMCSLLKGQDRVAFCMETEFDAVKCELDIASTRFYNQLIRVERNYAYESAELLADADYRLIHRCSKAIDASVTDSQDVVAFWMIQMNSICGKMMCERGVGIFRQASWHPDTKSAQQPATMISALAELPDSLPQHTRRLIANWKHTTGQYAAFDPTRKAEHATMGKESYVHITSPIRRITDLLNQIVFQLEFGMVERISDEARAFVEHWYSEMEYVNTTMRSIRKIQIDCDMLHRCSAHPEWMQHLHQGVIFDRISRTDGMYSYMVHLTGLNILARIVTHEKYENYQTLDFKMFVFEDEERLQRKIRIAASKSRPIL